MEFQYFGSGAGLSELSNFNACSITAPVPYSHKMLTFPSAEHYYVAYFKCSELNDAERLAIGGDLSTWDGMKVVYPRLDNATIERKIKYWKRRDMIGIIAKKFGSQFRVRRNRETDTFNEWVVVLHYKYHQNKQHRDVLLSTGEKHLVEFDRMAKPETIWGGKVVNGIVVGQNQMGKLMMDARKSLV